ncbi:riboflavin kinase [Dothidotthia symphoricarpi CBS 119687]|uniref:Riboflavin kinase n=1 Tax=Dothidotthia symphoricarpi CBS 119687 TaxID=1392245 RepID=A0A6A5ZXQ3_9PLEO|nr:riboflavin kinase [Dothidotthia symphoricarpi CBS 119687]KAF2124056.1 riboflavin kinase [Dothidotthia symphoricarpi CBS 119687]
MVRPNGPRDPIAGPDALQPPFPLKLRGPVIKGFGRGSKDLGIPTANIPLSGLSVGGNDALDSGIYYGWCTLDHRTIAQTTTSSSVPSATDDTSPPERSSNHAVADLEYSSSNTTSSTVYPTVLSVGYNPYYKNTQRSIEIHILHNFDSDFYGATLSLIILGFIRPEYDYVSKDALVEDIREDIRISQRSLDREAYLGWKSDDWLAGDAENDGRAGRRHEGAGQKDEVGMCQMDP